MVTPVETGIILQLGVAALLGGAIGVERELHGSPGGLRTHALVCMGAALFTVVSVSITGPNVDSSRIAAGIVTGIGFLGAGAIFRLENKVHGLTTAADLWVLAAIGISVGVGFFTAAFATTVIVIIILGPAKMLENYALRQKRKR